MLEDRILIVDDDPSWQELMREAIEGVSGPGVGPRQIYVAGSYEEANALLDRQHFHLAFLDLRLREDARELEGKKLAQKLVAQAEDTSIVIATGHADVSTAITALKQWKVLDFILKDEWHPETVMQLVQTGIPAARARYRARYESAIDLLRDQDPIFLWVARVLDLLAFDPRVARPDRRVADMLNVLLDGLYPLLPMRGRQSVEMDKAQGLVRAHYWSKALGQPVRVSFGQAQAVTRAMEHETDFCVRELTDDGLRARGVVTTLPDLAFEAFAPT